MKTVKILQSFILPNDQLLPSAVKSIFILVKLIKQYSFKSKKKKT